VSRWKRGGDAAHPDPNPNPKPDWRLTEVEAQAMLRIQSLLNGREAREYTVKGLQVELTSSSLHIDCVLKARAARREVEVMLSDERSAAVATLIAGVRSHVVREELLRERCSVENDCAMKIQGYIRGRVVKVIVVEERRKMYEKILYQGSEHN